MSVRGLKFFDSQTLRNGVFSRLEEELKAVRRNREDQVFAKTLMDGFKMQGERIRGDIESTILSFDLNEEVRLSEQAL